MQPLDAGFIMNFRTYRKLQTCHYLECIEKSQPTTVDIKQTLYFVCDAWVSVAQSTIVNGWQHTSILSSARSSEEPAEALASESERANLEELTELLANVLGKSTCTCMSATDFIECDANTETGHALTDEQILELVCPCEQSQQEEEDSQPPLHVTVG